MLPTLLLAFFACTTHDASHDDHAEKHDEHGAHGDHADKKDGHADKKEAAGHDAHGHDAHGMPEMKAAPEGAKVHFVSPEAGAELKSPVKVVMGVEGMEVKPAGELIDGAGHHHIIIDKPTPDLGTVVPADEHHIHFGKGQTEVELELKPGKHKLSLQFADGMHRSYGPSLTSTIEVTIVE